MKTILIVTWVLSDFAFLYAAPKPIVTAELIEAGHKVLDLGYDCAKSGAERVACHAQLATAIKGYAK